MTTYDPIPTTGESWQKTLRRERWWILLLVILAGVDAVGFDVNLELLLADNAYTWMVYLLVLGCALVSVAMPWHFGSTLRQRLDGLGGGSAVLVLLTSVWLGLGATMFYIRVSESTFTVASTITSSASTALGQPAASQSPDLNAASVPVAVVFLTLFFATGLLAATHSFNRTDEAVERELTTKRDNIRRQLAHEREARTREDHLRSDASEAKARLKEAEELEVAANEALRLRIHDLKIEQMSRRLGDPAATEVLLDGYEPTAHEENEGVEVG